MSYQKTTILPALVASLLTVSSVVPATAATAPLHPVGTEVSSIKNIESISDWQTLDTKHLILKINNAQRYLLTLDHQCMHLRGARLVGVSMTNQEIWADFDHVAADGWECRIDTITRLDRSQS